jgi:hypothetical protein
VTFGRLRVCAPTPEGALANCGRCEKCVRTMVALDMLGALPLHTSFPSRLERRTVRACWYDVASDFAFAREMIEHAKRVGRWDVVTDLTCATARSRAVLSMRKVARWPRRAAARARSAVAARRDGAGTGRAP